jgi:excinuclease ABC subunit A
MNARPFGQHAPHDRLRQDPGDGPSFLALQGARANNLKGEEVRIPLGVLTGVCGVSGSGKSTLIMDTLGRILVPKKYTTSVAQEPVDPGAYDSISGVPPRSVLIDQSRAGVTSPVDFLGLREILVGIFAESEDAVALGLGAEQLSRRCTACGGSGLVHIDMGFLPSVSTPCETCRATGLLPEAWQVRCRGASLPETLGLTLSSVLERFTDKPALSRPLSAAVDVGLGYLVLRQPAYTLSGGEAQRLKIAGELCRKVPARTLYILDEPTVGQHLADVERLVKVLRSLVDAGNSVLVVEHHPHLLAACDWLIELGPGGGPDGGRIIFSGTPSSMARANTPTAPYIRELIEAQA